MKKNHEEEHENGERWLLTYSDLVTLLMIFFIIMYAMSTVDSQKYSQLAQSLGTAMGNGSIVGNGSGWVNTGNGGNSNINTTVNNEPVDIKQPSDEQNYLENIKGELNKYLNENGLTNSVVVDITDRGLAIMLKDSIMFDSGRADIKNEAIETMIRIGMILNKIDSYIRVEGHTDNIPINNKQFNSNWQLSATRAVNVVQLLIDKAEIQPGKISAVGYGEYRPITDNSSNEGRAKNRRVEILVINSKFNKVENGK